MGCGAGQEDGILKSKSTQPRSTTTCLTLYSSVSSSPFDFFELMDCAHSEWVGVEGVVHLRRGQPGDGKIRRPVGDVPHHQMRDGLRHVPAGQTEVQIPDRIGRKQVGTKGKHLYNVAMAPIYVYLCGDEMFRAFLGFTKSIQHGSPCTFNSIVVISRRTRPT